MTTKSSEERFKKLLAEFLDETEDAAGICSDDQGQFCIYCDYYSLTFTEIVPLSQHDNTCLLVRTHKALAASEKTDIQTVVEQLDAEAKKRFTDPNRTAGQERDGQLYARLAVEVADHFGIGGEGG